MKVTLAGKMLNQNMIFFIIQQDFQPYKIIEVD